MAMAAQGGFASERLKLCGDSENLPCPLFAKRGRVRNKRNFLRFVAQRIAAFDV
jgi:hypothetical protein